MTRRLIAFILLLVMLAGVALPAQAGVSSLDTALSRWLQDQSTVNLTATLQLKTLMPYDDAMIGKLNGVLKHTQVNVTLRQAQEDSDTAFGISMSGTQLMSLTEQKQNNSYTLTTSLLPNRTLTSGTADVMDRLLHAEDNTVAAPTETSAVSTIEPTETNDGTMAQLPGGTSDIAAAFSMLDAVAELQTCYQALTDGIKNFATEKRANYNIKGIGAGKWSRIARLTDEQSAGLLSQLRAVLSCGMDEAYRAELAQATFGKGFIVALYQNEANQDICVYLKGDLVYPDGDQRRLVWQWAFTTNGLKRKDIFKYDVTRQKGTADSRQINSTCTQESRSDLFTIDEKTETILKRAKTTDQSAVRVELNGKRDENEALTCKGSVSQELMQITGEDTAKTTEKASVDLLFTPGADGSTLSGTINYRKLNDKVTQTEMDFTLGSEANAADASEPVQQESGDAAASESAPDGATPTPEATASPDASAQISSIEQIDSDLADNPTTPPSQNGADAYLVGALPIGVKTYQTPAASTTVNLDTADADTVEGLLAEAAQNFAAKLLLAVAALPEEDSALLADGMTEQDYAAFLALMNAL